LVSKIRTTRIADRVKQELSVLLIKEISDPRLEGIFVTDVSVDRELAYANVYVSAIEGSVRSKDVLAGLNHALGYIRRELSHRIKLRTFPILRFYWDVTPERAEHIEKLLASIHNNELAVKDDKEQE
jgi:ribosome-binding factor A